MSDKNYCTVKELKEFLQDKPDDAIVYGYEECFPFTNSVIVVAGMDGKPLGFINTFTVAWKWPV